MKKTLIVLSAAALAANLYAYDASPVISASGSIASYTKTEYSITEKFGDYYRSPKAKYVHVFDSTGKQTESTELTIKDALVDKIEYAYDAKGNLVSTICSDADGKVQWKILASYDAKGNKTEEAEYNAGDVLSNKSIWKITAGKTSEESYYSADGVLLGKTITKFDDQGKTTEVNQYTPDGKLDEKRVYAYNEAGKTSEVTYYDENGLQTKKVVFRFDTSFVVTEEQTYNAGNKLVQRIIYKYDATGNITKATTYAVADKFGGTVNELTGICEYAYDYGTTAAPAAVTPAAPVTPAPSSTSPRALTTTPSADNSNAK